MQCTKIKLTRKSADEFARIRAIKYQRKYATYKCEFCHFWHLTTQNPDRIRKVKNKKGSSKGNPESIRQAKRRSSYRNKRLPIESWENEGGSWLEDNGL